MNAGFGIVEGVDQIFELRHPDLAVAEGGLGSPASVPNNLPASVS